MSNRYHKNYFTSKIFDFDYQPIADAIINQYAPKSIIEFGCGSGQLSKALAASGVEITALDGYATPDFAGISNISFHKVDLNNPDEAQTFLRSLNRKFDLAISMEVAEHLDPSVSASLIEMMTSVAEVVVFSAAVPEQDGDGHINCQSRSFWHDLFEKNSFQLKDTIRKQIRDNARVGKWYALNTVDYVRKTTSLSIQEYQELIKNLVASESEASSNFYYANRRADYKEQILEFPLMNSAFRFRNFLKLLVGKKPLTKDL